MPRMTRAPNASVRSIFLSDYTEKVYQTKRNQYQQVRRVEEDVKRTCEIRNRKGKFTARGRLTESSLHFQLSQAETSSSRPKPFQHIVSA